MLKISVEWQGKEKLESLIRYISDNLIYGEAQQKVRILGHHCADHMRVTIDSSRKRPDKGTHKLENAITAETLTTTAGVEVGIGNIDKLKQEAPYYEVIDRGGYVPPANLGYFGEGERPEAGKNGQTWTHTGNKSDFLLRPSKAIEGIEYVYKSIQNLEKELKETITKLGGSFISGLSKASK
jgi:hypothetical protein